MTISLADLLTGISLHLVRSPVQKLNAVTHYHLKDSKQDGEQCQAQSVEIEEGPKDSQPHNRQLRKPPGGKT